MTFTAGGGVLLNAVSIQCLGLLYSTHAHNLSRPGSHAISDGELITCQASSFVL